MSFPVRISYFVIPTILILYGIRLLREKSWKVCKNAIKLNNKVVIVTGANTGIGYEIAKDLAARNATVIMACRDIEKAKRAICKIEKQIKKTELNLVPMELDLASLVSIKKFATDVLKSYPKIHYLVNNAGVSYPKGQIHLTQDNFEIHFGVNHLGHFYLTNLLLDTLKNTGETRIVVLTSTLFARGKIDISNLNQLQPSRDHHLYSDSKLANIYFARELARRTKDSGVNVYAVCPGWVLTDLFRHSLNWYHYILFAPIAFFYMRSAKMGAQTPIFCITDPDLDTQSGLMYRDCSVYNTKFKFDDEIGRRLWEQSKKFIEENLQ